MLNYLRIICTLAGCLPLLSVCYGGGPVTTCPHAKTNVLSCEHKLTDLVNAKLAPFGKSFSTIDLDNETETELMDEKARDVICSKSNLEHVACLIGNITACPDLDGDGDILSTWIASLIALHRDIINSPQSVCEFFQDTVCSYKELRLNTCYNSIVGEVETENTKVNMCVSNKTVYLTCMLEVYREVYRECKPYLNLTNNQNIATNIKDLMVEDHWETFSSGSQLCDCYEGKDCYSKLNQDITVVMATVSSIRDEYQNIFAKAEVVCSNITRLICAQKGQSLACKNVIQNFNESATQISVYISAVDSMCPSVNTIAFRNSKDCILDKLTESYHPCLKKAKLPATISTCRDFKRLYNCISDSLKGQCNDDYTKPVYEMIRISHHSVLACDVTSSAASLTNQFVTISTFMYVLYVSVS